MKFMQFLLTVIIAGAVAYGVVHFQPVVTGAAPETKETAYDRVMASGTLRCGYYIWPPQINKDPNTGQLSGYAYDFTNALAEIAELKIEWVEEINVGTYLEDLKNGRYDAECAEGWPNAVRAKKAYYTKPYAYVPVVAVVRADDNRFSLQNPEAFNDPTVMMATVDGETSQVITRIRFPKANQLGLPQNTPMADQLMNIVTGKADALLTDTLTAKGFMDANPGKLKTISYDPPLHVAAMSMTLPQDDRLKNMLDAATDQLIANGTIEKLIRPYAAEGLILLPNDIARPVK